jgi:hypothetical protein
MGPDESLLLQGVFGRKYASGSPTPKTISLTRRVQVKSAPSKLVIVR